MIFLIIFSSYANLSPSPNIGCKFDSHYVFLIPPEFLLKIYSEDSFVLKKGLEMDYQYEDSVLFFPKLKRIVIDWYNDEFYTFVDTISDRFKDLKRIVRNYYPEKETIFIKKIIKTTHLIKIYNEDFKEIYKIGISNFLFDNKYFYREKTKGKEIFIFYTNNDTITKFYYEITNDGNIIEKGDYYGVKINVDKLKIRLIDDLKEKRKIEKLISDKNRGFSVMIRSNVFTQIFVLRKLLKFLGSLKGEYICDFHSEREINSLEDIDNVRNYYIKFYRESFTYGEQTSGFSVYIQSYNIIRNDTFIYPDKKDFAYLKNEWKNFANYMEDRISLTGNKFFQEDSIDVFWLNLFLEKDSVTLLFELHKSCKIVKNIPDILKEKNTIISIKSSGVSNNMRNIFDIGKINFEKSLKLLYKCLNNKTFLADLDEKDRVSYNSSFSNISLLSKRDFERDFSTENLDFLEPNDPLIYFLITRLDTLSFSSKIFIYFLDENENLKKYSRIISGRRKEKRNRFEKPNIDVKFETLY